MGRKRGYINLRTLEGRHKFYRTPEWKAIRTQVLQKNPYCEYCLRKGIKTIATDVDHIIDIIDDPLRAMDITNLQGLCDSCHAEKTFSRNAENFKKPEQVNLKWKL